ncbi:uncharacterized protein LOC113316010 [Papaver somniferum]|uniref:uncharacterized protein LOC113316010 n=1 Tax=Papaver somniferum TaxID=3469 RepID=UPI000E6FEF37|nr:uncharacterized protein LOC113316010 [Papaver somniferum]
MHSLSSCWSLCNKRSKKKIPEQAETVPVGQTKKAWRKVNSNNNKPSDFDICFSEEERDQNTMHSHILDSEGEIVDTIVHQISQGGGGESSLDKESHIKEVEVNSGKFKILQNLPEEIVILYATKILELVSSAPSVNEVINVIPPLGNGGLTVKQKPGTNVTTRKHAASLVLNNEPKIRYSSDFIKKVKLSCVHYEIIHNSTDENKGNIWILWSASIKPPTIISCTRLEITIAVGGTLITGVHAAYLTINRRELWKDMEEINVLNKPWLVLGDFNVVTCLEEKRGGLKPLRISISGKKRIVCNLDREVFNYKWLEIYPSWGYKVGARGISDRGVLYGANVVLPKPKNVPFRALKVWKNHPSFKKIVIDSWNSDIIGNPSFIFMSKLKRLKKDIQNWNWNFFGDVTKKLKQAEQDVMKASLLSDKNPLDLNLLNNLVTTRGHQELFLDEQKKIIQQKSRVQWLKEGAANTKFFHVNLKIRQAQNVIMEFEKHGGGITSNQEEIADILIKHFEEKFTFQEVRFISDIFKDIPMVVNEDDNILLETTPEAEEIRQTVFELNPDSAPGPDGFDGWFYREVWEIIGEDFITAIKFWWSRGFIPNGLNANFLLLLPKVKNAKSGKQLGQLD